MHFMVFTESFTAEVMCRFLDRLAGHVDHKAHRVVDGHCAHRSKKVRDWLAAHPDDVETRAAPCRPRGATPTAPPERGPAPDRNPEPGPPRLSRPSPPRATPRTG
jgi:hypothetical protein